VGGGGLVISGSDAAEVREPVEAAFDGVASTVDLPVEPRRATAVTAPVTAVALLVPLFWMVWLMPRLRREA
jgi:hypothetical protein